jgi:hypothetical protein
MQTLANEKSRYIMIAIEYEYQVFAIFRQFLKFSWNILSSFRIEISVLYLNILFTDPVTRRQVKLHTETSDFI